MQTDDVLADLMDTLRVQLAGADDPLLLLTLRNVVRDLCRVSRVWKVEKEIPALKNIGALRVSNISGFGEPVWIERVTFNDRELPNRRIDFFLQKPEAGKPTGWAYEPPDRIFVNPILEDVEPGDRFTVRAALQPRLGDDPAQSLAHLPAHVLSNHSEMLIEATLGRMMVMPSKPWSNTPMASAYLRRSSSLLAKARIETINRRGTDPRTGWAFPNPAAWRRP